MRIFCVLWVARVDYQADVRVSDNILKQVSEVYRKIRNTFRFLLGNLSGFNAEHDAVSYENLREVDQYMLIKLNHLVDQVKNHMTIMNLLISIMVSIISVHRFKLLLPGLCKGYSILRCGKQ